MVCTDRKMLIVNSKEHAMGLRGGVSGIAELAQLIYHPLDFFNPDILLPSSQFGDAVFDAADVRSHEHDDTTGDTVLQKT